jgi:DNA-binding response OmpR family regulator
VRRALPPLPEPKSETLHGTVTDPGPDVLVVDDEPAIRQALERMLRYEGFAVRVAAGGREALAAIDAQLPAAIVLDVAMPDLDGVTVTRRLRARGIEVPICILSARDEVDDRVAGLRSGADDYLVKPFAPAELTARLHALLRRGRRNDAQPIDFGELRLDPKRHSALRAGRELDLTGREFELLLTLARHPGIVLTRDQLLELVWGYPSDVQTNVVDVFVGYLRRKLETGGQSRILHTVRGVGFVLRP